VRLPSGWTLLLQAVLLHAAYSVVRPMVSYRALDLGADSRDLGLLAASFVVLPLVLAFAVGRRADTLGPGRLQFGGSLLLAGGGLVAVAAGGLPLLFAGSIVLGLGHLVAMVGQQSSVAQASSARAWDRGFGSLTAAVSIGQMVGPPAAFSVASLVAGGGHGAGAVGIGVAALLAVLAIPLTVPAWRQSRQGATGEHGLPSAGDTFRLLARRPGMWQALMASGTVLAALDVLLTFLPAWAEERGVSVTTVGWLLALRAAVTVLTRVGVANLVAVMGRRLLLVGSLVLAVAGQTMLPYAGPVGAITAMFLLGIGLGVAQPLTLTWVTAAAEPGIRGAALGLRLTANRLAQTLLPPAVGFAAVGGGTVGVFLGMAVLLLLAATVAGRAPLDGTSDAAT